MAPTWACFSVVGGNLVLTDGTLDFENPTDANYDGVYEITVNVFDGNDNYQETLHRLVSMI